MPIDHVTGWLFRARGIGSPNGRGLAWSDNRRRFEARWKTMTPEERDRCRKGILGRYAPTDPEPKGGDD